MIEYVSQEKIIAKDGQPLEIKFQLIKNDNSDENLIKLINLKNIFSRQLPKMPKEYIVRLVLDKYFMIIIRKHRCLVSIIENTIVGGICFRPFFTQGFAEVVFCAIDAYYQVKV